MCIRDRLVSVVASSGYCGDDETCDDDGAEGLRSAPEATVSSGDAVTVVVTGYSTSFGEFDLHITDCETFSEGTYSSGSYVDYTCDPSMDGGDTGGAEDPVVVTP